MIKALNGAVITVPASEEDIVPFEIDENGEHKPAGRNTFNFILKTGSVKMTVGDSPNLPTLDGVTIATWATAGDTWKHTAAPEVHPLPNGTYGVADSSKRNIRAIGVGGSATINIFW